jgi:hypothetical protein
MGQSGMRALRGLGMHHGVDTGYALACRRFRYRPPQLHDLRDRSCGSEYAGSCVDAGSGYGGAGESGGRGFRDFPSRRRPVYSSSAGALISRLHQIGVFSNGPRSSTL